MTKTIPIRTNLTRLDPYVLELVNDIAKYVIPDDIPSSYIEITKSSGNYRISIEDKYRRIGYIDYDHFNKTLEIYEDYSMLGLLSDLIYNQPKINDFKIAASISSCY